MATGEKKTTSFSSLLISAGGWTHLALKGFPAPSLSSSSIIFPTALQLPLSVHSCCPGRISSGAAGSTSHLRGLQTSKQAWASSCKITAGWAGRKEAFHGKDKLFCSLFPKLRSCKFLAGWALGLFCARQGVCQIFRGWFGKYLFLLKTLFTCFSSHLNVIKNFIRHNHRKNKNNSSLWGGKRWSYSGLLSKS